MTKETITALMVAPGMNPCEIQLHADADFLKHAVSLGLIETADEVNAYPLDDEAAILCCKYAAVWGGKVNRRIGKRIFAGVLFIAAIKDRKLASLSPAALETYRQKLWTPLPDEAENDMDSLFAAVNTMFDEKETL